MPLRDISKMQTINDGTRTLFESVMMPEIVIALRDWSEARAGGVLIGALGLSYYARPRMTQDVDFLFLHDDDVPASVPGFTRTDDHEFQHDKTLVRVDIITTNVAHISPQIIRQVIDSAVESDGVKIASASGLVALKLHRLSMQHEADIIALIKTGKVDVRGFALSPARVRAFEVLEAEAPHDPHP
jgi:hypothetical protein